MEISSRIESFLPSLKTSFHAGRNSNENAAQPPIPVEITFKIPPAERINLTDKQILDNYFKPFLAEKYPDFFPINPIPSLELRQKFYADNKKDFSDYCNLMPAFPSDKYESRLKLLVNDLRLAYDSVNEKGIFVDYLSFLTKMVKTYPESGIQEKGSIHYSDLQSPELAKLVLNIYAELSLAKASDSDPILAHRRQARLESMLITNLNHILYDDRMNKSLEELLKVNHREASDLGVMFRFRQGYGDLPPDLNPSQKSNSAQDLFVKPVINFYRSSVDLDPLEQQALNKFNKAHPNNQLEMIPDAKTTLSSLEVKGLPLHLNKNVLVDMIDLVTQLNSSINLKFNTGISLKIPFTDDVLLISDLNKELQSKVKDKTIKHDEVIRLSRNPTIFENLQKDLDKDRMLIFKDLPLPVNLNNRKIADRAAPIQVNTFFNQSLLIKALANLRFDNKGKLADQLNFDRLKEHVIADKDFVDKLANVIVEPFSAQSQKFMQEIYNSIIQTEKNFKLKPVIDQLTNENCLPAFNPQFINKMIKNFIDEKEERNLLVKLNNRLQGKTFLKEVFEMTDDKLFELIKLAIKPDSPESRSLIETILNLSEPIQLKSLFKFANLLDSKILTDSSLTDLFINKIEKANFHDFAEEALKTSANIPPGIFEKILKTKVENLPDSAIELLETLKNNYIINRDNLKLFNSMAWSRPKFRDVDDKLFSQTQNIVGSRRFSDELGPLVFHNLQPFISEIGIGDFLQIMEQAQDQRFSIKPFRIKFNSQHIDYPEANDYLFHACAENESPIPIQPQVEDKGSLEKDMLIEDIYKIKLKPFSLPIDSELRKSFLGRIKDLEPVSKAKVFLAMKIPNKQILTELINSNIFPVELHDRLLERFSTKPENCSMVFNQAFSSEARESLLLRIIEVNKENLGPVVNNLNKFLLNNSNPSNTNFVQDFIFKAIEAKGYALSTGKLVNYLPDLKFSPDKVLDVLQRLKHIGSRSLNMILANPRFSVESKLHLLERVFSPKTSSGSGLNIISETKKYTLRVSSVLIPENQDLSSTFQTLAKMPSETHGKVLDRLKLSSADHLRQICDTELLSNQDRARFIKSIGTFDKDFLPYVGNKKLSDDSKQYILQKAYEQNKPGLVDFFSVNKQDADIKKPLASFVQRNASLIEYLPSFGFSLDEMKKMVEGIRQIDPRNYKNIFLTKDDNKSLKLNPLPDEILKLLTKHALEDIKNGEQFIKFVISNEDKLNKVVRETF